MSLDIRIEETYNNKYLGEWDLPENGKDMLVKVKDVEMEKVSNPKTNTETDEVVIHFEGNVKPMILSARVNKDNIKTACGTGHTKQWIGKKLLLYREAGTWFGKAGFAVRIRPFSPEA